MRTPGKRKNLRARTGAPNRCFSCGGPATTRQVDLRVEPALVTTWCEWHAPTVWQIVARARRMAQARQNQLQGRWVA